MTRPELIDELNRLRTAIRKHRDQKGDDRCYKDDYELYKILPEGFMEPQPDCYIDLNDCAKYKLNRQDPKVHYLSPQRRIEELEKENKALSQEVEGFKKLLYGEPKYEGGSMGGCG